MGTNLYIRIYFGFGNHIYLSDVIQSTSTPTHQHRNYGGGSVFRGDSMTWFDGGLVGLGGSSFRRHHGHDHGHEPCRCHGP